MVAHPREGLLQRLGQRLRAEDDIVLAIAFGSTVSGNLRPDSDIDLAVMTRAPLTAERRRALMKLLTDVAGRPVDLVDLRASGIVITRKVLAEGKRLVCRDKTALASLLSRTLIDAADFLPYRERLLRERRESWIR